jgi:hypothetical protein
MHEACGHAKPGGVRAAENRRLVRAKPAAPRRFHPIPPSARGGRRATLEPMRMGIHSTSSRTPGSHEPPRAQGEPTRLGFLCPSAPDTSNAAPPRPRGRAPSTPRERVHRELSQQGRARRESGAQGQKRGRSANPREQPTTSPLTSRCQHNGDQGRMRPHV